MAERDIAVRELAEARERIEKALRTLEPWSDTYLMSGRDAGEFRPKLTIGDIVAILRGDEKK